MLKSFFLSAGFSLLITVSMFSQKGSLSGTITNEVTGETLPGVAVFIQGTTQGTTSDIYGKYVLTNISPGTVPIVYRYMGFKKIIKEVEIKAGETTTFSPAMSLDAVKMQEAVVYGQATGQLAAINQQLNSNTIVNVVSSERIQELPDQNAAEAVGRLPGISVQRVNGEGQKVVVRGLSPKFNSITINGVRIPSTDSEDRSVDLSMISPEALSGIEVFKALRPDMDADAVGGSINFTIRKAASDPVFGAKAQLGYNDQEQEFGQWKFDVFGGKRLLDKKLGFYASANGQRANRSSDQLNADYALQGENTDGSSVVIINNLNLADRLEVRNRYSANLNLDYQFNQLNSITFNNTFGLIYRDELRRRKRYRLNDNYLEYDLRDRERRTFILSNTLNGYHQVSEKTTLTWQASRSESSQQNIFDHSARWREVGAYNEELIDDQGPEFVPPGADNNVDKLFLKDARADDDDVTETSLVARADIKRDFNLGSKISGYLKAGAKVRQQGRVRSTERVWTGTDVRNILGAEIENFQLTDDGEIAIYDFVDPNFVAEDFLDGDYHIGLGSTSSNQVGLSDELIRDFYDEYGDQYAADQRLDLESYSADERVESGYVMTELNWKNTMLMGGLRMENTVLDYRATVGLLQKLENEEWVVRNPREEVADRSYLEWLPMLHLRQKIRPWMDLRLAATKSLARPNFASLVPFQIIDDQNRTARLGNPDLEHTTALNLDAYLSMYGDKFGLFTIGVFYKELENVEYLSQTRRIAPGDPLNSYLITTPRNAIGTSYLRGIEFDFQTNFRWLPAPFDGIVLNANLSLIESETFYPFFEVITQVQPPFETVVIDTERKGTMPGQSDILANLSLGYEKGGFSGRISMVHQGGALFAVGSREEGDVYTVATTRWDLAINQRINKSWSVFVNLNNITNQEEAAFFGEERFRTNTEFFGFTADLGVKYRISK